MLTLLRSMMFEACAATTTLVLGVREDLIGRGHRGRPAPVAAADRAAWRTRGERLCSARGSLRRRRSQTWCTRCGTGPTHPLDPVAAPTLRPREILRLPVEDQSAKLIAAALDVSTLTVEFHKFRMMQSLGLQTSAELIHIAIKNGLAGA